MSKDRFLSVCMDPQIKRKMKEAAETEKRTLSSLCILVLDGFLERLPESWAGPAPGRKGKDCIGFRLDNDLYESVETEAARRDRAMTAICEMTFGYWISLPRADRKRPQTRPVQGQQLEGS